MYDYSYKKQFSINSFYKKNILFIFPLYLLKKKRYFSYKGINRKLFTAVKLFNF